MEFGNIFVKRNTLDLGQGDLVSFQGISAINFQNVSINYIVLISIGNISARYPLSIMAPYFLPFGFWATFTAFKLLLSCSSLSASCLFIRCTLRICLAKSQSSDLEVDANLSYRDENFYFRSTTTNKRSIYFQSS